MKEMKAEAERQEEIEEIFDRLKSKETKAKIQKMQDVIDSLDDEQKSSEFSDKVVK